MPFLVYAAILIATVFSVALEWDALVQPSTRRAMHAITETRPPLAVQPAVPATPTTPAPVAAPKAVPTPPPAAAPVETRAEPPSAPPDQPVVAETPAAPQCDVDACAAAYRTFRPSDCTYNSNSGRRLCTKGTAEMPDGAAPVAANCHIRACSESYSSFNPTDCTYQPLEGPRRLCQK